MELTQGQKAMVSTALDLVRVGDPDFIYEMDNVMVMMEDIVEEHGLLDHVKVYALASIALMEVMTHGDSQESFNTALLALQELVEPIRG